MIGKLLFALGLALVFGKGGKKSEQQGGGAEDTPPASTTGYRIIGCGDVEITDEAAAFAWARAQAKGRTVTELVVLLGGGCAISAALIAKLSPTKALFVWNLARYGLAGYVDGGGSTTIANFALSGIRSQAVAAGVKVKGWPEGLPGSEAPPKPNPAPTPKNLEVIDHGLVADTGVYKVHHISVGTGGPAVWFIEYTPEDNVRVTSYAPRDAPIELYRIQTDWPEWSYHDAAQQNAIHKGLALKLAAMAVDLQTLQAVLSKGDPRPWIVVGRRKGAPFALQLATSTNIDKTDNRAPDVVVAIDPMDYPTKVPGFPVLPEKPFSQIEVMVSNAGTVEESKAIAQLFAASGYSTNYIVLENATDFTMVGPYVEAKLRQLLAGYA